MYSDPSPCHLYDKHISRHLVFEGISKCLGTTIDVMEHRGLVQRMQCTLKVHCMGSQRTALLHKVWDIVECAFHSQNKIKLSRDA